MSGGNRPDNSELEALLDVFAAESRVLLVLKRGDKGVTLVRRDGHENVAGFPVEIVNTVGAGDGFASGLIFGWSQGWEWGRAAAFANACGAIVVSRQGCARALPYWHEVRDFPARQNANEEG